MSSSIIDKIIKKFDSEDVIKFSNKDGFKEIKSWAFAGSPQLDYNLGVLGLPTGIIEIAGKSRSGKTTLGLLGMKNFMKTYPEGVCIILSSENRDNKEYALKLGVDIENVIIVKIKYVEGMFMRVKKIIKDTCQIFKAENLGEPKFYILWDSLGATLSKAELDTMDRNIVTMEKRLDKGVEDGEMEHAQMAAFAKSAKMFAKYIIGEMYTKTIHFVMLNHFNKNLGGKGGETSVGGQWVELMCNMRLKTSLIENVKIDDEEVAQITEVKVVKNDFGSRKPTQIEILLGYGVVLSEEDIAFAVEQGIMKKEGALKHSFMNDKLKWSSKRTFYQNYKDDNKFLIILTKKIMDARHKQVSESKLS